MPKVTLARDPTKERSELFAANVDKYMRLRNKTPKEVAMIAGLNERPFTNRQRDPRLYSLVEMLKIMDYLKFSQADRAEVVGVEIKIYGMGG